jgi:hypothetical protein
LNTYENEKKAITLNVDVAFELSFEAVETDRLDGGGDTQKFVSTCFKSIFFSFLIPFSTIVISNVRTTFEKFKYTNVRNFLTDDPKGSQMCEINCPKFPPSNV